MESRQESFGQIVYDRNFDEFEVALCEETLSTTVDRPISAGCLVTARCNLKCPHCYGNDEDLPQQELDPLGWEAVFRTLRRWGLMRVDLSGGEPTVRSDLVAIVRAAAGCGLNVVVSTNGILLGDSGPVGFPDNTRFHVSIDSGFDAIHEARRAKRSLKPSTGSLVQTLRFIRRTVEMGYHARILTAIGVDNQYGLFELAEAIAPTGVSEWNISRVLHAGRARLGQRDRWKASDAAVLEQIRLIRRCFPWMRVRYSNRIDQDGYFLLVLPDGSLATQYTDSRDKVVLGNVLEMSLEDLRQNPNFDLRRHGSKWIAGVRGCERTGCPRCEQRQGIVLH